LINIIQHTTDEGDVVFDFFAGSGSIGVACQKTKRSCIMMEKNKTSYTNFIVSTWKN
jgi:DNA modification methylase